MSAYYFHATDGSSLEIDRLGDDARGRSEAERMAGEKACALMAERGPSLDWSGWEMHVYDNRGEIVATVTFSDADVLTLRRPENLAKRMVAEKAGRFAKRAALRRRT